MSPSVGNFVHDLVEMAKAMEELPLVRAELSRVSQDHDAQGAIIAAREESILRLKAEIEGLQAKVREAEVSRDDAELRFLELDEKAAKVFRILDTISASVETANELLSPKPEPVPMPEPVPVQEWPQPVATESWSKPEAESTPTAEPYHRNEIGQFASQGQSEPLPSVSSTITASVDTTTPIATPTDPAVYMGDDVGYHNEPTPWSTDWYYWCHRMDDRYGVGFWPIRPAAAVG